MRILSGLILLIFSSSLLMAQDESVLQKHLWQDRVILLFAEDADQNDLQQQLGIFKGEADELTERDLVCYQIFSKGGTDGQGKPLTSANTQWLRDRYEVTDAAFTILLIGKDGGVKLRSAEPVSTEQLFALIDAMPMRRAEMKRNKQ